MHDFYRMSFRLENLPLCAISRNPIFKNFSRKNTAFLQKNTLFNSRSTMLVIFSDWNAIPLPKSRSFVIFPTCTFSADNLRSTWVLRQRNFKKNIYHQNEKRQYQTDFRNDIAFFSEEVIVKSE